MTTKLTNAQAELIAYATREYAQAQTDFETWCRTCHYCNGNRPKLTSTFEEWVDDKYTWIAKRDQPRDVDGYIAEQVERLRRNYEMKRSGIIGVHTSSSTLRALEKKGLVEIIVDGRRDFDTIRLLYI